MDEENKKINLESFFNKIDSADKMASSALSKANSNLGIINNQKALIESLSVSIEAIQTKIRDIANYIIVEKKLERDLEEDRRLETEDAEQKRQMTERATAMGERGPQGEPGKPEPAQGGGGGGFLGGLIKLLVGGGVLAAALPTIGPMLLNQFVLPKIGEGLKFVFDKGMGWLSKNLGGVFNPATYAPLGIGKFFTGLKKGVESKFEGAKSAFGGFVSGFFKGDGGAGSGSNMSLLGDMSSVKNMETTLKENDLVEEKPKNVEMEEYEEEANKLKEERDIAEETGKTDISTELKKEASGGDEELSNVEVGRKFKVTKGKKEKTLEELESKYARLLAKIQKMKDKGRNSEMIDYEVGKANDLKFVIDMKKKEMGLIEDKGIGKSLIEAGMGKGKSSYSATTEYKFVEPIKKETEELDLSLRQNIETNDKLVNAVSYQSGTENKDQNSSVLVQNKPAQVTIASIKKTSSTVPFIKANKNKFLSINETELPPQVARMLT